MHRQLFMAGIIRSQLLNQVNYLLAQHPNYPATLDLRDIKLSAIWRESREGVNEKFCREMPIARMCPSPRSPFPIGILAWSHYYRDCAFHHWWVFKPLVYYLGGNLWIILLLLLITIILGFLQN